VVALTERLSAGSPARRARVMVLLPAPEADAAAPVDLRCRIVRRLRRGIVRRLRRGTVRRLRRGTVRRLLTIYM